MTGPIVNRGPGAFGAPGRQTIPAIVADPLPDLLAQYFVLQAEHMRLHTEMETIQKRHPKHGMPIYSAPGCPPTVVYKGETGDIERYFGVKVTQALWANPQAPDVEAAARLSAESEHHVQQAKAFAERWHREHDELGLAELERRTDAFELRDGPLGAIEAQLREREPRSIAGAIAKLRYALELFDPSMETERKVISTAAQYLEKLAAPAG
jgi:hypothetical protein